MVVAAAVLVVVAVDGVGALPAVDVVVAAFSPSALVNVVVDVSIVVVVAAAAACCWPSNERLTTSIT